MTAVAPSIINSRRCIFWKYTSLPKIYTPVESKERNTLQWLKEQIDVIWRKPQGTNGGAIENEREHDTIKRRMLTSLVMQVLLDAARKVGIEGAPKLLEDPNKGLKEVNEEFEKYSSGISGVLNFVINGKYKLSGGQPPEMFLRAFQAAANDSSA